ncbi:MAG: molecular chaperone HtpG [Agathobacter sp.]|nr:molecular chaperone HtpG [Agathobacter sp.]
MANKHGSLSIDSENLFPIIKKWLYSDHDIFYRELISNGCDAITKLRKLDMMGEYSLPADYKAKIEVIVNPEDKTIKFIDNGLGMTADEVEEYITKIAFSGATDFIEKYKDKSNDDQIIGHFGLGFYSAFMVADEVTIDTLSYQEGATAVHWSCDGGTEYDMADGDKTTIGTEITLYLNEDSLEFANEYRAREVIQKYCSFMPTEIYLSKANEEPKKDDEGNIIAPVALNDIHPLWAKNPKDCTEEEYKEFYRHVFYDYKEPLFWIHLNMDYPFNLKGILYFPKINTEYDSIEGTIKLYNNQVFIADNIKEVIPEFLMLLKGVIDCPDLPLNVSRSALQNDGFVKKISEYITKKVADKLIGMCKTEKESYEKYWDDISPFIKFGCLKDEKFCDKMNDYILFKDINNKYQTLPELLAPVAKDASETAVDENGNTVDAEVVADDVDVDVSNDEMKDDRKTVYYVTDINQQGQYITLFQEQGMNAVILNHNIDTSFISQLEMRNENYRFMRIDADLTDSLKEESGEDLTECTATLSEVFKSALNNDKLTVKVEKLKNDGIASVITLSEEGRRMQDMMKMYAMQGMGGMDMNMFAADQTLTLNANNALVQYILENKDSEHVPMFAEQLYDLALLSNQPLSTEAMAKFVKRSNDIMLLLTK